MYNSVEKKKCAGRGEPGKELFRGWRKECYENLNSQGELERCPVLRDEMRHSYLDPCWKTWDCNVPGTERIGGEDFRSRTLSQCWIKRWTLLHCKSGPLGRETFRNGGHRSGRREKNISRRVCFFENVNSCTAPVQQEEPKPGEYGSMRNRIAAVSQRSNKKFQHENTALLAYETKPCFRKNNPLWECRIFQAAGTGSYG